jgi:hypothetical protein
LVLALVLAHAGPFAEGRWLIRTANAEEESSRKSSHLLPGAVLDSACEPMQNFPAIREGMGAERMPTIPLGFPEQLG